ncbi:MAG: hypothetical protein JXB47_15495 [Anaerolineae bacterium]|nr:hypothetical protein [Anaerolineae bacterium]
MKTWRARLERGEGSLYELTGMIVLLVLMLDIGSFVVIGRPAQVAAAGASRACARMAVDTLSSGLGPAQGIAAGQSYLEAAGIHSGAVSVQPGGWNRRNEVTCTVSVEVPAGTIGLMKRITGVGAVQIQQSTTLTIGAWQSRWTSR